MLCLDNDVLRKFLSPKPSPEIDRYLKGHAAETWCIPALVAFEFYRAYSKPQDILRIQTHVHNTIDQVVQLSEEIVIETVNLDNSLRKQNVSLDPLDLLHAGTARHLGSTFVTHNKNDFDKPPIHHIMDIDVIKSS